MFNNLNLVRFVSAFAVCLIWSCASVGQSSETSETQTVPTPNLQYIETDDTIFNVKYVCFKLAEKARDAYIAYDKDNLKAGNKNHVHIGHLTCTADPSGMYAHVSLVFSSDEHDPNQISTGPTVFAVTSNAARSFKWSLGSMGTVCMSDDWKTCIDNLN